MSKEFQKYKDFYEEVKTIIRNLGKSNMISKDEIQDLIDEVENK